MINAPEGLLRVWGKGWFVPFHETPIDDEDLNQFRPDNFKVGYNDHSIPTPFNPQWAYGGDKQNLTAEQIRGIASSSLQAADWCSLQEADNLYNIAHLHSRTLQYMGENEYKRAYEKAFPHRKIIPKATRHGFGPYPRVLPTIMPLNVKLGLLQQSFVDMEKGGVGRRMMSGIITTSPTTSVPSSSIAEPKLNSKERRKQQRAQFMQSIQNRSSTFRQANLRPLTWRQFIRRVEPGEFDEAHLECFKKIITGVISRNEVRRSLRKLIDEVCDRKDPVGEPIPIMGDQKEDRAPDVPSESDEDDFSDFENVSDDKNIDTSIAGEPTGNPVDEPPEPICDIHIDVYGDQTEEYSFNEQGIPLNPTTGRPDWGLFPSAESTSSAKRSKPSPAPSYVSLAPSPLQLQQTQQQQQQLVEQPVMPTLQPQTPTIDLTKSTTPSPETMVTGDAANVNMTGNAEAESRDITTAEALEIIRDAAKRVDEPVVINDEDEELPSDQERNTPEDVEQPLEMEQQPQLQSAVVETTSLAQQQQNLSPPAIIIQDTPKTSPMTAAMAIEYTPEEFELGLNVPDINTIGLRWNVYPGALDKEIQQRLDTLHEVDRLLQEFRYPMNHPVVQIEAKRLNVNTSQALKERIDDELGLQLMRRDYRQRKVIFNTRHLVRKIMDINFKPHDYFLKDQMPYYILDDGEFDQLYPYIICAHALECDHPDYSPDWHALVLQFFHLDDPELLLATVFQYMTDHFASTLPGFSLSSHVPTPVGSPTTQISNAMHKMKFATPTSTTASGSRPTTRSMVTKPVSSSSTGEKAKRKAAKNAIMDAGQTMVRPALRRSPRKQTNLSTLISSPTTSTSRHKSSSKSPQKKQPMDDDAE